MATYEEARANKFARATTTTVTGVPLDVSGDHPLRRAGNQPFQLCVCVTDPCPCADGPIVWVGEEALRDSAGTGRRTTAGDEIREFAIDADAQVVIESFRSVKASELSGARKSTRARGTGAPPFIIRRREGGPQRVSSGARRGGGPCGPCGGHASPQFRADPGCNDVEVEEDGTTYCFVESSEHYCIYELC
ncbi:hypothetical protein ACH44C_12200 [Streptomyces purpureus]|uniref:hypothetical protein n=1 Tax=Streptomyces purpureus TaxID=1951 RepID=UPI003788133F